MVCQSQILFEPYNLYQDGLPCLMGTELEQNHRAASLYGRFFTMQMIGDERVNTAKSLRIDVKPHHFCFCLIFFDHAADHITDRHNADQLFLIINNGDMPDFFIGHGRHHI